MHDGLKLTSAKDPKLQANGNAAWNRILEAFPVENFIACQP
jgi:hypothetical protein